MRKHLLITITLLLITTVGWSATFCVSDSTELQSALTTAQDNLAHDVIKIKEGNYVTPGSEFYYYEDDGFDLQISGGWSEFFGNPCGQQTSQSAFNTVLDGNSQNRVLRLRKTGSANISVSNLTIINGLVDDPQRGGGIHFYDYNNASTGTLVINNTFFINNEAKFEGAISASGAEKITLKNNLFVGNHSLAGNTVSIVQNDGYGVYATNNTFVSNTTDASLKLAGLRVFVSGTSRALVANNLLWGNDNHDLEFGGSGDHYLHNNDIGSRTGVQPFSDINNFSLPPRFASGILNFTPSEISPLVNKGRHPCTICPIPVPFSQAWGLGSTDTNGNTRIQHNQVDIGAFESAHEPDLIYMNGLE